MKKFSQGFAPRSNESVRAAATSAVAHIAGLPGKESLTRAESQHPAAKYVLIETDKGDVHVVRRGEQPIKVLALVDGLVKHYRKSGRVPEGINVAGNDTFAVVRGIDAGFRRRLIHDLTKLLSK